MGTRIGVLSCCLAALAATVAVIAPAGAATDGGEARCWPALEGCPAKEYERKAARAASRYVDEKFRRDIPPSEWRVTCYPGESARRIQCSVHSIDPPPYECLGDMLMVKREGRWRATKVQIVC